MFRASIFAGAAKHFLFAGRTLAQVGPLIAEDFAHFRTTEKVGRRWGSRCNHSFHYTRVVSRRKIANRKLGGINRPLHRVRLVHVISVVQRRIELEELIHQLKISDKARNV